MRDVRSGVEVPDASACAGATLTVPAGTPWDDVVRYAVEQELTGLEALSGIPGSTGATPVQNVGAYGQEVSQSISIVRVWDRARGRVRTLPLVTLAFGYRTSLLKRSMHGPDAADPQAPWSPTPRYVVLDVTFQLRPGDLSRPVAYPELARTLGIEVGERAPLAEVRSAVLGLRAGKGMVLDPADHDTWSAGSFFTNPLLTPAQSDALPADAPRFPAAGRPGQDERRVADRPGRLRPRVRLPGPGDAVDQAHPRADEPGRARRPRTCSTLAREVRAGVSSTFGITLEPEPVLVGLSL